MYFAIVRASGGYRAHIHAANHEIVFWTEVYTRKSSAIAAAQLVQAQAAGARIVDTA